MKLELLLLPGEFVIAGLEPDVPVGPLPMGDFAALMRDPVETTLVLPRAEWERLAPQYPGARLQAGYRCFRLDADFPPGVVGVLARLTARLASAGIALMAYSTFKTDLLLVVASDLERALAALDGIEV